MMNTLVALPIAGALPVAMAIPDAAAAPTAVASADPIFSLIEDYRTAAKTAAAAASEVSRREDMLIEQGLGLSPFISVLNASGPGNPQPTMVYKHEYIDRMLPADRFSKPNAAAHASLDAQIERHKAVVGDSETVLYAALDAETEALDTLIWTPPTTIAGVLALLELFPELQRARVMDDDQAAAIIISVIDALDDIHPNARLANMKSNATATE
jgi:hypothetical protein